MRTLGFLMCVSLVLLHAWPDQPTMPAKASSAPFSVTQASADWARYTVKDGEFSVLLPAVPAMSSYSVRMNPFGKSLLRNVIGAYSQGVVYSIHIFERKQSLEEFIGEFSRTSQGDFVREVNISGVRGKEYGLRNDDRRAVTDFFVTERHIYVFQAHGSYLGNPDTGIPRFLESIRFGRNLDGQVIIDGPGTQPSSDPSPTADKTDARIVSGKEVDRKAVVIAKPEPSYTEDARQHQVAGTVVLRCVFSSSGAVTNIHVFSSLPDGLDEKAIAVARQIKFIPAIKDGRFVSMWMQLEYNFNLY